MATTIYKIVDNVKWDGSTTLSGSTKGGSCDLSNYYTKTELNGYKTSSVHYSNIIWDGQQRGNVWGVALVSGYLQPRGGMRGNIYGVTLLIASMQNQGVLHGTTNGTSLVTGFFTWVVGSSYVFDMSIVEDSSSVVTLVGDEESPGNSQYYGTDAGGTKGYYTLPAGGGVDVSGTPVDNQLAIWTDSNTIEGSANLTFDGTNLNVTGTIKSGTTGTSGRIELGRASDGYTNFILYSASAGEFQLTQNGGLGSIMLMGYAGFSFQTEETNPPYDKITRVIIGQGDGARLSAVNGINTNHIAEYTAAHGTVIDNELNIVGIDKQDGFLYAGSTDPTNTTRLNYDGNFYATNLYSGGTLVSVTGHNHDSAYISIVSTPTTGNFPVLTAGGELNNSAYSSTSFATADHLHTGVYEPHEDGLTSLAGLTYVSAAFVKMTGADTFTLDTATYSASTHVHGNITSAGAIGSTTNLPIITTTSGVLTTGTFGTGANTFCQGNDSRLSDARTPTSHTLASHTTTCSSGQFLKGTGTDTFGWASHGLTYTDVGAQQTHANLTSLSNLSYSSLSFVKMTAAGTFSLDTATYASSSHNHDSAYISIVSTPTTGNFPILTAGGELQNSSYSNSSFATSGHTHTGMVDASGTPVDNQVAVWTDANTIEGTSGLTYTGSALSITGTVTSTGDMTATNFCLSSDIRQKTNINCYCEAPLLDINYQTFELKSAPGVIRYGAIAQEVQKNYPELVRVGEDGMLTIAYIDLLIREVAYLKHKIKEYQDMFNEN